MAQNMVAQQTADKVPLADAISNVDVLDEVALCDDVPCIQSVSSSIVYHVNYDTNFEDRKAFARCDAKCIEEATVQANMNRMLEEGERHAINLYTWRCCSRSIPQPKSHEQPNRVEIYEKTVEVLGPEVNKLLAFMYFQRQAVDKFCQEIGRLCHAPGSTGNSLMPRHASMASSISSNSTQSSHLESSLSSSSMATLKRGQKGGANEFVSETYLLTLGKFINMFATLDELKNMKSSVKNDYATYRRAAQFLKVLSDSQSLQESQNLSMFLAMQNKIRDSLKESLEKIPNYETLLCRIVNLCMQMFEESKYILPSEKHMLVKVIGFGLFLIDGKNCDINKLDAKKKVNLSAIDKIFKELEMVPLFGDMQIAPYITYVRKMTNFDSQKWPLCSNDSIASNQAEIQGFLPKIRTKYVAYISELSRHSNEATTIIKETSRTDAESKELLDLALLGLRLLSDITCHITELYSWKLMHPTDHHQNHSCPQEAEEYERATRYNYNDEEKSALIELISMVKGLQVLMNRMETVFIDAIKRSIYARLQDFIQVDLREPLRKAILKKDDMIRLFLKSVRGTCADWIRGIEDPLDQANKSDLSKPEVTSYEVRVPRRNVGPSSTQLYMVRTMLESLVSGKAHGDKSTLRKYIDGASFMAIENFLKDSFYWQYLLNFSQTLSECCDLSQLWYREFYLEMTMGRRIQFPIEMSLPSILIDHIIKTKDPAMMECILYPLDLYNDSAYCALTKFCKQFLYDEVEAEVNLCFDQFIYKLSEQIFAYYKHLAGSILLDKRFRSEAAAMNIKFTWPTANRYGTLLKQRHLQLLGRTIDLNRLIAQRLQASILKNLELAITRFEEGSLTDVIELEGLLGVNKYTHKLLSEHVKLDSFDNLLKEANRNVSAPYGRITLHIIWELMSNFLPHYCYNSSTNRFVKIPPFAPVLSPNQNGTKEKSSQSSQQPPYHLYGTKALNIAFSAIHQLYSNFIGAPHFRAIAQLLGYQGVAVVIDNLLKVIKSILEGTMNQYCKTLQAAMPKVCKLPLYDYGSTGVLEYYQAQLKDVIVSPVVKPAMFQAFREMGNAMLFCMLIEQSLSQEEVCDLLQAAPFQNILPAPFCKDGERPEGKIKRLEQKYASLQVLKNIEHLGNDEQAVLANEGDLLTTERLCCGLSIFDAVLNKIKGFLLDDRNLATTWVGPANNPPVVMYVDECVEFHRIWSALQFIYCTPVGQGEFTIEQLFGEGLNWAGCIMITLLGQQKRFEALDFCYHLLKVQRVDGKDDVVRGVPLKRMVDRIRRFQVLNTQIFSTINKYLNSNAPEETKLEQVKVFSSPIHPAVSQSVGQPIYMRTAISMQRPPTNGTIE